MQRRREAIIAEKLSKQYPNGVWGVIDISFTANWGQIIVLVGPNGAGKTTTVGMLTTLLKPTKGHATIAGHDVVTEAWKVRRHIALVPQEARIDPNWTPWEAVKWYLVSRGWSINDAHQRAREILEQLGLWEQRNRSGWGLSGGEKRKTVLAMIIACEADVLFLDEPTTGLDVESKYKTWEIVRKTAREEERTIVFTTHDMREAETLADKAILIHQGKVIAQGNPQELKTRLPYTYRVVVKGARKTIDIAPLTLNIGDITIAYAATRSEATAIASTIESETATIEPVSFEDVYLYHLHKTGHKITKEVIRHA